MNILKKQRFQIDGLVVIVILDVYKELISVALHLGFLFFILASHRNLAV